MAQETAASKPPAQDYHEQIVRVYWEDTDAGGIVYHASYIRFFERGRTEFLRSVGVAQSQMQADNGERFVVSKLNVTFRAPALLDDLLIIRSRCTRLDRVRLVLEQIAMRGSQELVSAEVICAAVDEAGRPIRFSPALRRRLEAMQQSDNSGHRINVK